MQIKKDDPGLQKVIYGAFGLPFGLALIVICGGELYTGNAAFMPAAMMEGKCTILQLLKNWCGPWVRQRPHAPCIHIASQSRASWIECSSQACPSRHA